MTVTRWGLRRAQAVLLTVLTVVSATAVVLATAAPAEATHFRYRSLTWEKIGPTEVRFSVKVAERGTPQVGSNWTESISTGDGGTAFTTGTVVAVNPVDDWFLAETTGTYTYPADSTGPFTATWQSCCTISPSSGLRNSPDSSLQSRAVIDFTRTTASPVTSISPIVNILKDDGTGDGIRRYKVPAQDPDGSVLRYRLATQAEAVVDQPPGLSIDPVSGVMTWPVRPLSTPGGLGLYIATVVVADAAGAETQVTFLFNLGFTSGGGAPPEWTAPTPADRTALSPSSHATFRLRAFDPELQPVTISNLGLPAGLSCAPAAATTPGEGLLDCTLSSATTDFSLVTFDAQDSDGNSAGPRNYTVGGGRYVALGDGVTAGSGVPGATYEPATVRPGVDECRRATEAWPRVVAAWSEAPQTAQNAACWQADVADLTATAASTTGPPWDEGAQLARLGQDVTLVTLQVGAEDVGLDDLLRSCINTACLSRQDGPTRARLAALAAPGPDGRSPVESLVLAVRAAAPKAQVVVVGYPRVFAAGRTLFSCALVRPADQRWLNSVVGELNDTLESAARRTGVRFADVEEAFDQHTACEPGPLVQRLEGGRPWQSFQPTAAGQTVLGQRVLAALQAPLSADVQNVRPGATETVTTTVPQGARSASFANNWPGSDVVLTLVAPSGRLVQAPDRQPGTRRLAPDVEHVLGPTSELFLISDPEPGTWTVHRFGLDVGADGEPSALVVDTALAVNQPPTAVVTQSVTGPRVTLSAVVTDPDGTVRDHLWDLGDGTTATTPSVTHAYRTLGTFLPTLVVTDDRGAQGFAEGTAVVVTTLDTDPEPEPGPTTPPPTDDGKQPVPVPTRPSLPRPPASASPSPSSAPASPSAGPDQPGQAASPSPSPTASPSASPSVVPPPPGLSGTRRVVAGSPVLVAVSAAPGTTVELWGYTRPGTTYRLLRHSVVVPASGVAVLRLRPLTSTRLAAKVVGGPLGRSLLVLVSPRVTLHAVPAGPRTLLLSGSVGPARAGVPVRVFGQLRGGREVMVAGATTDRRGRWQVLRTFGAGPVSQLQARTRGDDRNAAGASAWVPVSLG